MAVTVILRDGRRLTVNGRHERMIEAIVENATEWSQYKIGQLVFNFSEKAVRAELKPNIAFDLPPAED